MDLFKKYNINQSTCWEWNCKRLHKRVKGETQKLHKLSRHKIKKLSQKEINEIENKRKEKIYGKFIV